jgi:hypothetical protein
MPLPASLRPFIIAPTGDNHNGSDLDSFVLASPKLDEMLRGFDAIPPDRTHRAETPSGTARGPMNPRGSMLQAGATATLLRVVPASPEAARRRRLVLTPATR